MLALALALAACRGAGPLPEIGKNEAAAIADEYVAREFAPVPPGMVRVVVVEHGPIWRVTYYPPEDTSGGSLAIDVDKRSRQVVGVRGEQ